MSNLKLYTYKQLESAFREGRMKGQSDITGVEWVWGNMARYLNTPDPIEMSMDIYNTVIRKMNADKGRAPDSLTYRPIIAAVTRATHEIDGVIGVSYNELITHNGNRRNPDAIATPRMLCYYLCYIHTDHTYQGIGDIFGKRKHDTVLKGARKMYHWCNLKNSMEGELLDQTYTILQGQGYTTTPLKRKLDSFVPYIQSQQNL